MFIFLTMLVPIVLALLLPIFKLNKFNRKLYVIFATCITSFLVYYIIFFQNDLGWTLIRFSGMFSISFVVDELSKVFAILIATLWPLASIYAVVYMEHKKNLDSFFRYFLIAYGIAIGLTFSSNFISLYFFYELLTFLTLPLIMHEYTKEQLSAGKTYLIVSMFGAGLALMGIIILSTFTSHGIDFRYGGVFSNEMFGDINILYVGFLLCFFGFGVKAGLFPFTFWLPACGVAPTPVSALFHAVVVVKAGAFAIIRTVYYAYGVEFLTGTIAQNIALIASILTILYGSCMAVREKNIKRRLAYSTASNLSYILFAVSLMTDESLKAGLTHMLFHAITKILLFFVAGAFILYNNVHTVDEVKGMANKMKVAFYSFAIASLSIIGIPLTCGFISKYLIVKSAMDVNSTLSLVGLVTIIVSIVLTVIYLMSIVVMGFTPSEEGSVEEIRVSRLMNAVFIFLSILIIYFGVNSSFLLEFLDNIIKRF